MNHSGSGPSFRILGLPHERNFKMFRNSLRTGAFILNMEGVNIRQGELQPFVRCRKAVLPAYVSARCRETSILSLGISSSICVRSSAMASASEGRPLPATAERLFPIAEGCLALHPRRLRLPACLLNQR